MSLEATVHAPLVKGEIQAYTTLAVSDVEVERNGRRARVTEAVVYWNYADGDWHIKFIQFSGPYLKKDGTDSKQTVSFSTKPGSTRKSKPAPPVEIEAAALAWKPDWAPR